jgi:tryptophan synthase alpha chain
MKRIASCFKHLAQHSHKALIPYLMAGDPNPELTVELMHALVAGGANMIELGMPFSDPMADGPVIQQAHERALAQQVGIRQVLTIVADFRRQDRTTPVILMGYANPVETTGYERFVQAAAEAGADGLIIVDLPPEEAEPCQVAANQAGLAMIYLLAPTTEDQRAAKISAQAQGYLYYVALKGVTGAGSLKVGAVANKLAHLRTLTSLPVCVGFGIKDPDSAAKIAMLADGVIVGSALVERIAELQNNGQATDQLLNAITGFIGQLRAAMDQV